MKVKIFDESHEKDLEEAINNYIKEKDGIMICTLNGKNRKSDKGIRNITYKEYQNMDYTVVTEGKLIDLFDTIYNISKEIYEKSR